MSERHNTKTNSRKYVLFSSKQFAFAQQCGLQLWFPCYNRECCADRLDWWNCLCLLGGGAQRDSANTIWWNTAGLILGQHHTERAAQHRQPLKDKACPYSPGESHKACPHPPGSGTTNEALRSVCRTQCTTGAGSVLQVSRRGTGGWRRPPRENRRGVEIHLLGAAGIV